MPLKLVPKTTLFPELRFQVSTTPIAKPVGGVDDLRWGFATSFEALPFGQPEWDAAVKRLGGSLYMTWDWLRTWWEFYGSGLQLRLFWFQKAGDVVGLVPLYVQRLGPRPLGCVVARLVGANIPPKVFDPPAEPHLWSTCLGLAVVHLLHEGCDLVCLGPISETHRTWESLEPEIVASVAKVRVRRRFAGVHTVFPLASDYEVYFSRLGKNEQKNRRKYELRLLHKEHPVHLVFLKDAAQGLEPAFERFAQLHTRQWYAEGLTGHFGAWPQGLEYNRAQIRAQAAHGRARLMELWAGEELVCGQYAFAWADRWFWELPARAPEERWLRFSLGPSGLMLLLAEAMREGRRWVEGGLGHYEYKLRLGGREHRVGYLYFAAPGSSAAARRLWSACVQAALRIGYHKIWYRRVQPRLPDRWRRPQWTLWLHYDY